MIPPAVLFTLPIEASIFLKRLTELRITSKGIYEGRLGALWVRVGVSGMGYERSMEKTRELLEDGAEFLVVSGFAAGLDDTLSSGDLVVAGSVVDESASWNCDRNLAHIASGICGSKVNDIVCVREVVCTSQEKLSLAESSGCAAIDMESAAAASVACESNMPLAVVRAVVDSSKDSVPKELACALKVDGGIELTRLMAAFVRHPQIIVSAVSLGIKSRRCAHKLADFLVEFLPAAHLHI